MSIWKFGDRYDLRLIETPDEMAPVEALQRVVWSGSETEVVPTHLLQAVVDNGGLLIGAYEGEKLVGFVFGFPGFYPTPDGPRSKHCSHMLAVHPEHRDQGLGFVLKRAQWQMVRHQGLDCITWTYDPLLSLNAHLNIARLGSVCNTYIREAYGEMRDGLNIGLPSDRFQVDWWVNTRRVTRRLSRKPRPPLELAQNLEAEVPLLNTAQPGEDGFPHPTGDPSELSGTPPPMLLVEIPADFPAIRANSPALALEWRLHTRVWFEELFERGYLVTDSIYEPGSTPRSFYVLSYGEAVLEGVITVSHP